MGLDPPSGPAVEPGETGASAEGSPRLVRHLKNEDDDDGDVVSGGDEEVEEPGPRDGVVQEAGQTDDAKEETGEEEVEVGVENGRRPDFLYCFRLRDAFVMQIVPRPPRRPPVLLLH